MKKGQGMNNLKLQGGLVFSLALVLLLYLSAVPAFAVDDTDDVQVSVSIPPIVILTLDKESINWLSSQIGINDYNTGYTLVTKNVNCNIKSNTNWILTVHGSSQYFNETSPWQKPVGDIEWQDGGPGFNTLLWNDPGTIPVAEGGPQDGSDPDTDVQVGFHILLDWDDDVAGYYEYSDVVFTLSNT